MTEPLYAVAYYNRDTPNDVKILGTTRYTRPECENAVRAVFSPSTKDLVYGVIEIRFVSTLTPGV